MSRSDQFLREQIRDLEALLHAILRRHHPNGCEIARIEFENLKDFNRPPLKSRENPARNSLIVWSAGLPGADQ